MPASASSIFGGGSASSIFAAGVNLGATEQQQAAQEVVNASNREIKRIRGYKVQLTPAENKRLGEIQKDITRINSKVSDGSVRSDELEDRELLYLEADTIIGKPSAGVENDETLDGIREKIDELLSKRLTPQQEKRIETLTTLQESFQDRLDDDPSNINTIRQLQNIQYQINQIDQPRSVSQLSVTEKKEYDELVDQANTHAGAKLLLNSRDSIRVQNLQETIDQMASSLPADPASQPTAASVARAYARIG
ncbi:MAG: hypothetical protein DHS20C08_04000 [Rhodomicrobium sp.]|nr:MAG: hypothetical protein DHS20C08_04000 [Rhodomicrobium sp.]